MRLAFVSDLHAEFHLDVVGTVADHLARLRPDAVLLAGDLCPDLGRLEAALRLLAGAVPAPVLTLPGNHELWCGGAGGAGPDSRRRYFSVLPTLAARAGAVPLGIRPLVHHGVAFVGVTGWYDYSLRDPSLVDVTDADYRSHQPAGHGCVDGIEVHFPDEAGRPLDDAAITGVMVDLLGAQLEQVRGRASRTVVATHFLVDRALLAVDPGFTGPAPSPVLDAYQGAVALGARIRAEPGVVRVISGHRHVPAIASLRGVEGAIPCEISPIGYPREVEGGLAAHVARRVRVVEV